MNCQILPPPYDLDAAKIARDEFTQKAEDDKHLSNLLELASTDGAINSLLEAVFGASPFLTRQLMLHGEWAHKLLSSHGDKCFADWRDHTILATQQDVEEAELICAIRQARNRIAMIAGLADMAGIWPIDKVSENIAIAADLLLGQALNWALAAAARQGQITLANKDNPSEGCGYAVLAMGKHGAFELNYSSDIDLIVLYDPELAPIADGVEAATFFVRLTRKLVALLQDVTGDGYAYRVDLRLRPDPRATQIAIAMEAAATYYENMGQNWERAAMIKARPAAGDLALGAEFLDRLTPYVWRKYLDYAAISDIQSLKRQMHAVKGHGTIAVAGHNIKLGRGGIREIEFFVQTQQLIAGGRHANLRGKKTLAMLGELAKQNWIDSDTEKDMAAAYRFLRRLENRLQMLNDQQVHTLPDSPDGLEVLARFAGFETLQAMHDKLVSILTTVQDHYVALFEDADDLGSESGNLVFTGGEDDPETLATLSNMGFKQTSEISAIIRGWHFGRYNAVRSSKSRELLTEIMPVLLKALAEAGDPDAAFIAFDRFLSGLPAGIQLFSMLRAKPNLLHLIALVMGTAPKLSAVMSKRPRVLDAVIDQDFFGALPTRAEYDQMLDNAIGDSDSFEEILDIARIVGSEQMFRIGVRILSATTGANEAGAAFSNLADALINKTLDAVEKDITRRHGKLDGGAVCVLAMGKHGGRAMATGSDLDLILIYDMAQDASQSDGDKPLGPGQYYTRLTQRLISALSVPTAEGTLYEVDMRLRPSGTKGPVATHIDAFVAYHEDQAWVWEKLAMSRARVVAGDAALAKKVEAVIVRSLTTPRNREDILPAIHDMRAKLREAHKDAGIWNIKHPPGGLVDIEFIAQSLQLLHGPEHPELLDTNTVSALGNLAQAGILTSQQAEGLIDPCRYHNRLTQLLRLCVGNAYDPATALPGLNRLVARILNAPDIATAEVVLGDYQKRINELFTEILGPRTNN